MKNLWRRLMRYMYFRQDGEPVRCTECGCTEIVDTITDRLDYMPLESEQTCAGCQSTLGYWAHGYYDLAYVMGYLGEEQT